MFNPKCGHSGRQIVRMPTMTKRLIGSSFFGVKEMNFNLIGPVRGTRHETW